MGVNACQMQFDCKQLWDDKSSFFIIYQQIVVLGKWLKSGSKSLNIPQYQISFPSTNMIQADWQSAGSDQIYPGVMLKLGDSVAERFLHIFKKKVRLFVGFKLRLILYLQVNHRSFTPICWKSCTNSLGKTRGWLPCRLTDCYQGNTGVSVLHVLSLSLSLISENGN